MKIFETILPFLFDAAENLIDKNGEEKMEYVLDIIVKLDDATPLAIIPNKIEEFCLKKAVQIAFEKWKSRK